jgi:hypothetical protein
MISPQIIDDEVHVINTNMHVMSSEMQARSIEEEDAGWRSELRTL